MSSLKASQTHLYLYKIWLTVKSYCWLFVVPEFIVLFILGLDDILMVVQEMTISSGKAKNFGIWYFLKRRLDHSHHPFNEGVWHPSFSNVSCHILGHLLIKNHHPEFTFFDLGSLLHWNKMVSFSLKIIISFHPFLHFDLNVRICTFFIYSKKS